MAESIPPAHGSHEDGPQTPDAVKWEASVWAELLRRHDNERRRLHDLHREQIKDVWAQHQGEEGPVEGWRLVGPEDVGNYLVARDRQRLHHRFDTMYLESRQRQEHAMTVEFVDHVKRGSYVPSARHGSEMTAEALHHTHTEKRQRLEAQQDQDRHELYAIMDQNFSMRTLPLIAQLQDVRQRLAHGGAQTDKEKEEDLRYEIEELGHEEGEAVYVLRLRHLAEHRALCEQQWDEQIALGLQMPEVAIIGRISEPQEPGFLPLLQQEEPALDQEPTAQPQEHARQRQDQATPARSEASTEILDIPGEPGYGQGGIVYRNAQGQLHREDGPARIVDHAFDGIDIAQTAWYVRDGVEIAEVRTFAVRDEEGAVYREEWFKHGKHHREDGPAVISYREHYILDETHLDESIKEWWLAGVQIDACDRTYEDIIAHKPLPVRQAFGYDLDDDIETPPGEEAARLGREADSLGPVDRVAARLQHADWRHDVADDPECRRWRHSEVHDLYSSLEKLASVDPDTARHLWTTHAPAAYQVPDFLQPGSMHETAGMTPGTPEAGRQQLHTPLHTSHRVLANDLHTLRAQQIQARSSGKSLEVAQEESTRPSRPRTLGWER